MTEFRLSNSVPGNDGVYADYPWSRKKLINNPSCEYFRFIAQIEGAPATNICSCDSQKCVRQCEGEK